LDTPGCKIKLSGSKTPGFPHRIRKIPSLEAKITDGFVPGIPLGNLQTGIGKKW